jgi:hypothetical protein
VHEEYCIGVERYAQLLEELAVRARTLQPAPDSVVGLIRSGLMPAVYLSHQLHLPLFTSADVKRLPVPKLTRPLLVDTTCWSGGKLRMLAGKLERLGAQPQILVMFARAAPLPAVDGLNYLYTSAGIPRFWYEHRLGDGAQAPQGAGRGSNIYREDL